MKDLIMAIGDTKNWAFKKGYYHHSQPSTPDYYTFFQKGIIRPARSKALKIVNGETDGVKEEAEAFLEQHGYYIDYLGKTQFTDNINMASGRAVEYYCDQVLIHGAMPNEAYREVLNLLLSLQTGSWLDQEKTKAQIEGRQKTRFGENGKAGKLLSENQQSVFCEFELVCQNAHAGLKEAMQGANEIIGQTELRGKLPGCQLDYLGYGDYQGGAVELKTQWDTGVDTDSPRSNSLPKDIKHPHLMQIAGYWHITGKIPRIVYANRLGYRVFEATIEQLEYALSDVIAACVRREKLMMVTENVEQLLKLCDPHFADSFVWRDVHPDVLRQAKKLAGVIK